MKKCLTLILLLTSYFAFSQDEKHSSASESKAFSIGIHANHVFGSRSDQQYQIEGSDYNSELIDKSFTQLYTMNFGYSFKNNLFARVSLGGSVDYINIDKAKFTKSISYGPGGAIHWNTTSISKTTIIDRNTSYHIGAEFGAFVLSNSRFKLGTSIGLSYSQYHSNIVLTNDISERYFNPYYSPTGTASPTEIFSYDNQSATWQNSVRKIKSSYFSPKINILVGVKITDQFFIEFQAGQQFSFTIEEDQVGTTQVQFPIGLGLRYHLF